MSEFTAESDPGDPETYGAVSVDDEDQLQPIDSLVDSGVEDVLDEGYSPPEGWSPAEGFGNTPAEALQGESLDQRIAQEVPEPDPYLQAELEARDAETHPEGELGGLADPLAGRLVADDLGSGEDLEKDLVAYDVGLDGAGASAEEAAVHVIED